jgi:decaprenylphospho-beta-D-erythro-pentofuranosid-2-ulose 2-reductase
MKSLIFGATSTVAQELQKLLATRSSHLVLIGRNQSELKSIADDLRVRGAQVDVEVQDLLIFHNAESFVGDLWLKYGSFDFVFFAHGVLGDQSIDQNSVSKTIGILNSNFVSHVAFITPIANALQIQKKGIIAVITSIAGERGKQSNYIYCAAKAGMIAFLSGLRNRMHIHQVQVVDIRMGFVDTTMTKHMKKGPLWAKPQTAAMTILRAIEDKKDIVYVPFFWFWIMLVIRFIPEALFKRFKL